MEHIQQWGDKLEAKTNLHTVELYHNKSHLCVGFASLTHTHTTRERQTDSGMIRWTEPLVPQQSCPKLVKVGQLHRILPFHFLSLKTDSYTPLFSCGNYGNYV